MVSSVILIPIKTIVSSAISFLRFFLILIYYCPHKACCQQTTSHSIHQNILTQHSTLSETLRKSLSFHYVFTLLILEPSSSVIMPVKVYSDTEIAELLKPQSFDWADDKEELEEYPSCDTSGPNYQEPDGECVPAKVVDEPSMVSSFDSMPERPFSPEPMERSNLASSPAVYQDEASSWLQVSVNKVDAQLVSSLKYQAREEIPKEDDYQLLQGEAAVEWEFCHRNDIILDDCDEEQDPIHHFNWHGHAVREYSGTPAAHSLLYILSRPKTPAPRDENRIQSILNRATKFVDPVIYEGDFAELQRSGQDLVNAVTGQVYKFYSPHGCWHNDRRDREEGTIQDNGVMNIYKCPEWLVANGFYDHPLVPTREQMHSNWENLRDSSSPCAGSDCWKVREKRSRPYIRSPLRLATAVDTDDCSDMNQNKVHRMRGKYQWWEASRSIECFVKEVLLPIPEEETESSDDMASSQSLFSSTDASLLTDSESSVMELREWMLLDQNDSFDTKPCDRRANNANRASKGTVYKHGKASAWRRVPHKILSARQTRLYSIAVRSLENTRADSLERAEGSRLSEQPTNQHNMMSESQDDENTSKNGQEHSADEDVPEVRLFLRNVVPSLSLFSIKTVVDMTLTTLQRQGTSHTVSNPLALNLPVHDAEPTKHKNPLTRIKSSKLSPKRLRRQRAKVRGRFSSRNSSEETLTYFSFPKPVFSKDLKGYKKWLSGKVWRDIAYKLLDSSYVDEEGDLSPPVLCVAAVSREQMPSPPPTQAEQKPRKNWMRKVAKNFIDGFSLMGDYPARYM
ncbi:hypothetical protein VTN96DRAFT_4946 [Rasamsonia emersonii]